jgi:hypothetical protein
MIAKLSVTWVLYFGAEGYCPLVNLTEKRFSASQRSDPTDHQQIRGMDQPS